MSTIDLPNPGPQRFWHGVHNATSPKTPLTLELREMSVENAANKAKFSRLIGKQPTIADPIAIKAAAEEIITRAGRVDEFVGILGEGS